MNNLDDNVLWRVIVPRLDRIETKLDDKTDHRDLRVLEERIDKLEEAVENLERAALTSDQVKNLIGESLRAADARGWTRTEVTLAKIGAVAIIGTLILSTVTLVMDVIR